MRVNENKVKVSFNIEIYNKKKQKRYRLKEKHSMRYYFLPEIEYFLSICGFSLLESYKWLSLQSPGSDSWYVICVAQKR